MYTFLFCARAQGKSSPLPLRRAAVVTKKLMPTLGLNLEVRVAAFPGMHAEWFHVFPASSNRKSVITHFTNENVSIIVFGHTFMNRGKSTAEVVSQAWRQGGMDAVRLLDGCFSAVVVDSNRGTITIASDVIGRRSLHFFSDGEFLLVSPHDVPIVATGICPIEFDLVSAAAIIGNWWSLGGKSLLKSIQVSNPHEYVTWKSGELKRIFRPLIIPEQGVDPKENGVVSRHVDFMIEKMRQNTRSVCDQGAMIHLDLTAGLDTRTVLPILLSLFDRDRIKAFTTGGPDSPDVKIAGRLAKFCGIPHEYGMLTTQKYDDFAEHLRVRSFLMNGDTNGKRAIDVLPGYDETPHLDGTLSELYRGFNAYPDFVGEKRFANLTEKDIWDRIKKKSSERINALPWISDQIISQIGDRRRDAFTFLRRVSSRPQHLIELYSISEAWGRWGAIIPLSIWRPFSFSPFDSPDLLRRSFHLLRPIYTRHMLHKRILRRYLPAAFCLPINQTGFLFLLDHSRPQVRLLKLTKRTIGYFHKVEKILAPSRHHQTHEQVRARIFRSLLAEGLRDVFLDDRCIGTLIFEQKRFAKMIDDHVSQRKNYLQPLGFVASIEDYRKLIEEAVYLAKRINLDDADFSMAAGSNPLGR